jgi:hypothetical protein
LVGIHRTSAGKKTRLEILPRSTKGGNWQKMNAKKLIFPQIFDPEISIETTDEKI